MSDNIDRAPTRILLVEDNELNRDMLTRRLVRKGYQVDFAEDGQQALDKISISLPDLVLLDMNLPVLNGWDTCQAIRAEEQTQHLPVIALTAHAMAEDENRALEAGCDDFATKPIDLPSLLEKIERLTQN